MARRSCRSSRRPVSRAPRIAARHRRRRADAEQRPVDTSGQVAEHAGDAKAEPDGGVRPDSAKRVGSRRSEGAPEASSAPRISPTNPPSNPINAPSRRSRSCADTSPAPVCCGPVFGRSRSTPKASSVIADRDEQSIFGNRHPTEDLRPRRRPSTAGPSTAKRRQSIRPARMWETRRGECRNGRDTDVRPGTRGRARGGKHEDGKPDVPEHEAHEAPCQRCEEAPEADRDEEESVQALEYHA